MSYIHFNPYFSFTFINRERELHPTTIHDPSKSELAKIVERKARPTQHLRDESHKNHHKSLRYYRQTICDQAQLSIEKWK